MFFKYNKWALFLALIIFVLCVIPGKDIPNVSLLELINFDKFVHAGMFFTLFLLATRGFLLQFSFVKLKQFAKPAAFVICSAYGGLLEIIQGAFCQGRTASIFDFIADTLGALIGWWTYNWMEKKFLVLLIK